MILMRYVTMVLLGSAHVMAGPRRPGTEQGVLQRGPGGGVRLLRGTWRDAGVQDMGKPSENHGKTIGKPEKMGFSMGFIAELC